MKVIFLDVDGVLNADSDFIYHSGKYKGEPKSRGPHVGNLFTGRYRGIDNKKVKRLAQIVSETGAVLVLVSTWKEFYEKYQTTGRNVYGRYLSQKLAQAGLKIYSTTLKEEQSEKRTGWAPHYMRGLGIEHWLENHKDSVTKWIAIDDEEWDYLPNQHDHIVRTVDYELPYGGLLDRQVKEAIQKLK